MCLAVLKALTSDETNSLKNRISVIPESFQRSIYYVLLRGRPGKAPNSAPPVNLSRVVSSLISLSDKLLRKQAKMELPGPKPHESVVDTEPASGNYFHSHLVSLSIGCLIELCLFIKLNASNLGPGKKQRANKKQEQASLAAAGDQPQAPADA